ncbi:MAG: PIN domain-containing protein [Verrucomicrobiota bacterium]
MKYLLDVNALIGWAHQGSPHYLAFHRWKKNIVAGELATCAITELGFVRVSILKFGHDLPAAVAALAVLKGEIGHFLTPLPPPVFPPWATTAAHTTDAYLCQIAAAHGLRLATFDRGIRDRAALPLA